MKKPIKLLIKVSKRKIIFRMKLKCYKHHRMGFPRIFCHFVKYILALFVAFVVMPPLPASFAHFSSVAQIRKHF